MKALNEACAESSKVAKAFVKLAEKLHFSLMIRCITSIPTCTTLLLCHLLTAASWSSAFFALFLPLKHCPVVCFFFSGARDSKEPASKRQRVSGPDCKIISLRICCYSSPYCLLSSFAV